MTVTPSTTGLLRIFSRRFLILTPALTWLSVKFELYKLDMDEYDGECRLSYNYGFKYSKCIFVKSLNDLVMDTCLSSQQMCLFIDRFFVQETIKISL